MDVNASGSDLVPSTADIDSAIAGNVIEASLAKRIKKRGALRGSATKLRNRVSERLDDETAPADMFYLKDKIQTIKQKIESLNKLDDEIIDLMASCDDEEAEGRIEMDIEASDLVRTELNAIVNRMECVRPINKCNNNSNRCQLNSKISFTRQLVHRHPNLQQNYPNWK